MEKNCARVYPRFIDSRRWSLSSLHERTLTRDRISQASSRKERLQWNKERTLLGRKVVQAEKRARELGDGVASPEEVRPSVRIALDCCSPFLSGRIPCLCHVPWRSDLALRPCIACPALFLCHMGLRM